MSEHKSQDYHISGISGNLEMSENWAKVREKAWSRPGNLCSQGFATAQQNNLPVLYLYCNSFFIRVFREILD